MSLLHRHAWPLLAGISAALLVGGLFGCAGVAAVVWGSSDFRVDQPNLPYQNLPSHPITSPATTSERFLGAFGEPDEIIALGPDRERFRYRTGLRFHGVALLLIVVPLPLLVPTGVHDTFVEIERGIVVQVRGSQNAAVARIGCMIGPLAQMFGDGGCFAGLGTAPDTARIGSGELWLGPLPALLRPSVRRGR